MEDSNGKDTNEKNGQGAKGDKIARRKRILIKTASTFPSQEFNIIHKKCNFRNGISKSQYIKSNYPIKGLIKENQSLTYENQDPKEVSRYNIEGSRALNLLPEKGRQRQSRWDVRSNVQSTSNQEANLNQNQRNGTVLPAKPMIQVRPPSQLFTAEFLANNFLAQNSNEESGQCSRTITAPSSINESVPPYNNPSQPQVTFYWSTSNHTASNKSKGTYSKTYRRSRSTYTSPEPSSQTFVAPRSSNERVPTHNNLLQAPTTFVLGSNSQTLTSQSSSNESVPFQQSPLPASIASESGPRSETIVGESSSNESVQRSNFEVPPPSIIYPVPSHQTPLPASIASESGQCSETIVEESFSNESMRTCSRISKRPKATDTITSQSSSDESAPTHEIPLPAAATIDLEPIGQTIDTESSSNGSVSTCKNRFPDSNEINREPSREVIVNQNSGNKTLQTYKILLPASTRIFPVPHRQTINTPSSSNNSMPLPSSIAIDPEPICQTSAIESSRQESVQNCNTPSVSQTNSSTKNFASVITAVPKHLLQVIQKKFKIDINSEAGIAKLGELTGLQINLPKKTSIEINKNNVAIKKTSVGTKSTSPMTSKAKSTSPRTGKAKSTSPRTIKANSTSSGTSKTTSTSFGTSKTSAGSSNAKRTNVGISKAKITSTETSKTSPGTRKTCAGTTNKTSAETSKSNAGASNSFPGTSAETSKTIAGASKPPPGTSIGTSKTSHAMGKASKESTEKKNSTKRKPSPEHDKDGASTSKKARKISGSGPQESVAPTLDQNKKISNINDPTIPALLNMPLPRAEAGRVPVATASVVQRKGNTSSNISTGNATNRTSKQKKTAKIQKSTLWDSASDTSSDSEDSTRSKIERRQLKLKYDTRNIIDSFEKLVLPMLNEAQKERYQKHFCFSSHRKLHYISCVCLSGYNDTRKFNRKDTACLHKNLNSKDNRKSIKFILKQIVNVVNTMKRQRLVSAQKNLNNESASTSHGANPAIEINDEVLFDNRSANAITEDLQSANAQHQSETQVEVAMPAESNQVQEIEAEPPTIAQKEPEVENVIEILDDEEVEMVPTASEVPTSSSVQTGNDSASQQGVTKYTQVELLGRLSQIIQNHMLSNAGKTPTLEDRAVLVNALQQLQAMTVSLVNPNPLHRVKIMDETVFDEIIQKNEQIVELEKRNHTLEDMICKLRTEKLDAEITNLKLQKKIHGFINNTLLKNIEMSSTTEVSSIPLTDNPTSSSTEVNTPSSKDNPTSSRTEVNSVPSKSNPTSSNIEANSIPPKSNPTSSNTEVNSATTKRNPTSSNSEINSSKSIPSEGNTVAGVSNNQLNPKAAQHVAVKRVVPGSKPAGQKRLKAGDTIPHSNAKVSTSKSVAPKDPSVEGASNTEETKHVAAKRMVQGTKSGGPKRLKAGETIPRSITEINSNKSIPPKHSPVAGPSNKQLDPERTQKGTKSGGPKRLKAGDAMPHSTTEVSSNTCVPTKESPIEGTSNKQLNPEGTQPGTKSGGPKRLKAGGAIIRANTEVNSRISVPPKDPPVKRASNSEGTQDMQRNHMQQGIDPGGTNNLRIGDTIDLTTTPCASAAALPSDASIVINDSEDEDADENDNNDVSTAIQTVEVTSPSPAMPTGAVASLTSKARESIYVPIRSGRRFGQARDATMNSRNSINKCHTFSGLRNSVEHLSVHDHYVLAATDNGDLYKYDLITNKLIVKCRKHDKEITGLFVCEDYQVVFTISLDCYVAKSSLERVECCQHVYRIGEPLKAIDINWGIAYVGTVWGCIFRYDLQTSCINKVPLCSIGSSIVGIKTKDDGEHHLLVIVSELKRIVICNANTGLLMRLITIPDNLQSRNMVMSDDHIFCTTTQNSIYKFDITTCEQKSILQICSHVTALIMFRCKYVLAGCVDGYIYMYNADTCTQYGRFLGAKQDCTITALGIAGDKVIVSFKDKHMRMIRIPQGLMTLTNS